MNFSQAQLAIQEILKLSNKKIVQQFILKALRYVDLRINWFVCDQIGRIELDDERAKAHNVFIDYCNIIAREMIKEGLDATWRKQLGNDRKVIGDFACYLVAEIGVKAR